MKKRMSIINRRYRETPEITEQEVQTCREIDITVKWEMSNRLASLKAVAYCTVTRFPYTTAIAPAHCVYYRSLRLLLLTAFAPTNCIWYHSHNSLTLNVFSIITTRFAGIKKIAYQKLVILLHSLMMNQLRNVCIRARIKNI